MIVDGRRRFDDELARPSMAVTRGLLLDLLTTGDSDAVTAAFELFLQLGAAAPGAPAQP